MFDDGNDDFFSSEDIFGSGNTGNSDSNGGSLGDSSGWGSSQSDDESYDLSSLGTTEDTSGNSGFGESNTNSRKNTIKYAIIILVALVLLIFLITGLRKWLDKDANNQRDIGASNTTVETSDTVQSGTSTVGTVGGSWVEFNGTSSFEFSSQIESTFTATNIRYFASVANSYEDKSIKAVVTGNVSGLVGSYEMEIPYDMASGLSVGVSFKCYYKIADAGEYKVVTGITYKQ